MNPKKYLPYLLIILCGLVYLPALNNPFVWDDVIIIQENPYIGSNLKMTAKDFMVSRDYFNKSKEGTYRPVATALYYVVGLVSGKNPAGYRLANIILNIIAGILVMLVGLRLAGVAPGLIAGLLFVMHPIHSETIFVVSFNEDIIMTVLLLGAFLTYMDYISSGTDSGWDRIRFIVSGGLYFLSCLAKEVAVVFPVLIIFYEKFSGPLTLSYAAGGGDRGPVITASPASGSMRSGKVKAYMVYVSILAVCYLALRFAIHGSLECRVSFKEVAVNLITRGMPSLFKYVSMAVFPFDFQIDRVMVFTPLDIVAGVLVAGWLVWLGFFNYRRKSGFWVVFFILPLLPVMNIVPIYFYPVTAERYLYLPSVSVCLVGGALLADIESLRLRNLAALSVFLIFVTAIFQRASDYSDNLRFWQKAFESSPASFMAANSLGNEYKRRGDLSNAEFYYRKAIELKPDYAEVYVNLGSVLGLKKDYPAAEMYYKKAIGIKPSLAKAYSGLGIIYMWQGKFQEAELFLRKAIELDSTLVGAYYFLAGIYEKNGRPQESLAMYEKVLELDPANSEVLNASGLIASSIGDYVRAISYFRRLTKSAPGFPDGWVNMGNVYFIKKEYQNARFCYQQALKIKPDLYMAGSNLERIEKEGLAWKR